jgi:hypothetical protein
MLNTEEFHKIKLGKFRLQKETILDNAFADQVRAIMSYCIIIRMPV